MIRFYGDMKKTGDIVIKTIKLTISIIVELSNWTLDF